MKTLIGNPLTMPCCYFLLLKINQMPMLPCDFLTATLDLVGAGVDKRWGACLWWSKT